MYNFYRVDFDRLIVMMIPKWYHKAIIVSYLKSLLTPIKTMSLRFNQKRSLDEYKIAHNGQVCYLRKVLNDSFDPTLRRIQIVDGNRYSPMYIYTDPEMKPKFLNTIHLRDESVYQDTGIDFLVLLPKEVYDKQITQIQNTTRFYDVEGVVDYYKLASKRYKIQLL